jgi:branched-chain amino acid transport system substrate-binding protein
MAAMRKTGGTDGKALAAALRGMTIDSPFGANGKITMRAEDQTVVDYATGWGSTISSEPYVPEVQAADWKLIYRLEAEWKKRKGYA